MEDNLPQALARAAEHHAGRQYLTFYDDEGKRSSLTFDAFMRSARQFAALFKSRGVGRGDRVVVVSGNRPEVLLSYWACWLLGAVACPINSEETQARKRHILQHAGCKLILLEEAFRDELEALTGEIGSTELMAIDMALAASEGMTPVRVSTFPPETGAFLVYTSGTTGDPKGVLLSHDNLLSNAEATAAWHGFSPADTLMTVLPIHHVNGAVVTGLTSFLSGSRHVLNRRFSARTFWRRMADELVTVASLVPTLLEFLLAADEDLSTYDLSATRYLLCGAGPLLGETVTRFEARFALSVCHGFGMSETTAYNTQFPMAMPSGERRYWYNAFGYPSIGCELACNEVSVLREDGSEAAPLERGQLAVRGRSVMKGYLDDPAANAAAFRDGWFLSGDEGFFEIDRTARKFFFVSGRIKELIVRGGVNVSPLEIDEVLRRFDGVQFALSVPFENTFYGEEIAAYVVPEEGHALEEAEVLAFTRLHLPFAKQPKVVLFGKNVPFTTTGKPKRVALAAELAPRLSNFRETQFRDET